MAYPTSLVQLSVQANGPTPCLQAVTPREYPTLCSHLVLPQCHTVDCMLTSYKGVSKSSSLEFTLFLHQTFFLRTGHEFMRTGL